MTTTHEHAHGDARDDAFVARIRAAQAGDPDAREALLLEHLPGLRAFVRLRSDARSRARESSSDLVQSVCREALEGLPRFEPRDADGFRAWLFTLALNKLRERWRFHGAERRGLHREDGSLDRTGAAQALGSLPSPSEHALGRETDERFEAAFDRLSEAHREVILLSRLVGLPHAEVARRMGRSELATRSLLSRALVALSAALGDGHPPELQRPSPRSTST